MEVGFVCIYGSHLSICTALKGSGYTTTTFCAVHVWLVWLVLKFVSQPHWTSFSLKRNAKKAVTLNLELHNNNL